MFNECFEFLNFGLYHRNSKSLFLDYPSRLRGISYKIDRTVLITASFATESGHCWIVVCSFFMISKLFLGETYCFVRLIFWAASKYVMTFGFIGSNCVIVGDEFRRGFDGVLRGSGTRRFAFFSFFSVM